VKKFFALVLSAAMVVSLVACGGGGQSAPEPPDMSSDQPLTGEITVSAFDSMSAESFLREAAALFEDMHPGTTVNIETFSAMPEMRTATTADGAQVTVMQIEDDPQARTDYINRISAQLMAGGGPDILAMDVLPIDRFARSGFLEDLSAYMKADPDFNHDDFRTNIFDAAKLDGGLWFVPLGYSFEYHAFDSTLIPPAQAAAFGPGNAVSFAGLMEIGAELHDGSAPLFDQPEFAAFGGPAGRRGGVFRSLLSDGFESFVDLENRTAHLDDGRFAELLTSTRENAQRGLFPPAITGTLDIEQMMRIRSDEQPTERVFFKTHHSGMLQMDFLRGLGESQMMMFGGGMGTITDDDQIAGIAADNAGNVPFRFTQGYAINSNSQNKRLAWEFVKFLLSEEMQASPTSMRMGTPVRLSAVQPQAEMFFSGMFGGQPGEMSPEVEAAMHAYLEAHRQMADQINTFTFRDAIIDDMITAEVALFFDGSKSADEVAAALQSRVGLYLSE